MKKKSRNKIITNTILFFIVTGIVSEFLPYIMFFLILLITLNISQWLAK